MSALSLFAPPSLPPPVDGGYLATRLAGKHASLVTGHFCPDVRGATPSSPSSTPLRRRLTARQRRLVSFGEKKEVRTTCRAARS